MYLQKRIVLQIWLSCEKFGSCQLQVSKCTLSLLLREWMLSLSPSHSMLPISPSHSPAPSLKTQEVPLFTWSGRMNRKQLFLLESSIGVSRLVAGRTAASGLDWETTTTTTTARASLACCWSTIQPLTTIHIGIDCNGQSVVARLSQAPGLQV